MQKVTKEIALRNSSYAFATTVAGPALIVAGIAYPGSWKAKGFIAGTGVVLMVLSYPFVRAEAERLLRG